MVASTARAEERRFTDSPHTEASDLIVGAKLTYVDEHAEGERERGAGAAVFVELTLVEDLLELELGFGGVVPEDSAAQLAFEPLLKTTFRAHHRIDPYLGVGPALLVGKERPSVRGGGQLVVGSYLWMHDSFGFDVDVGCSLLSGHKDLTYEITLGVGPVLRL